MTGMVMDFTGSLDAEILTNSALSAGLGAFGAMFSIFSLALYLFYSFCLYLLAKKLGEQYAWMAFVPVLNIVLMLRMAGMSLWWILGFMVPFLNIYGIIIMQHRGISLRTGHNGWWTAGLIFFGFIFLPLTAFGYKPEANPVVTLPTTPPTV